ncbi:MAG: hypothetical protein A2293_15985 [Elusimicrobia bacterium RIFOXYB2_FULL_49_7]|nr:MAG: hypothetical protein A2293_15985 [Elusimicrobia bacterium RIFOXYB2_FULL_49_7]
MRARLEKRIALILLLLGAGLRLRAFFSGRGLWGDEAHLALAVIKTPFVKLSEALYNLQAAPLGFLYLSKAMVIQLGQSEPILRLFPLLTGLFLLGVAYGVAKEVRLPVLAGLFFLLLLAIHPTLVYYSSEFKPYGSDAFFAFLLLYLALRVHRLDTFLSFSFFFIISSISLFFSFPAVFVFGGLIGGLLISRYRQKRSVMRFGIASLGVLFLFLAIKVYHLDHIRHASILTDFWANSYPPLSISATAIKFWFFWPFQFLSNPGDFLFKGLWALLFLCGSYFLWKENREHAGLLLLPFVAAIGAAILHLYPFQARLALYLLPFFLFVAAVGAQGLYRLLREKGRFLSIVLIVLILFDPVQSAVRRFVTPHQPDNLKPVMEYVAAARQNSDRIYVYYGAASTAEYYALQLPALQGLQFGHEHRQDIRAYEPEIDSLFNQPGRTWMVFTHAYTAHEMNERDFIVMLAEKRAKRLDYFHAFAGADGYLFESAGQP